jgi:hypothetical protein
LERFSVSPEITNQSRGTAHNMGDKGLLPWFPGAVIQSTLDPRLNQVHTQFSFNRKNQGWHCDELTTTQNELHIFILAGPKDSPTFTCISELSTPPFHIHVRKKKPVVNKKDHLMKRTYGEVGKDQITGNMSSTETEAHGGLLKRHRLGDRDQFNVLQAAITSALESGCGAPNQMEPRAAAAAAAAMAAETKYDPATQLVNGGSRASGLAQPLLGTLVSEVLLLEEQKRQAVDSFTNTPTAPLHAYASLLARNGRSIHVYPCSNRNRPAHPDA